MVDTDDVQGYGQKFENQMRLLEESDIDDRDREAIRRFIYHLDANDTDVGSKGTLVGHLNKLRLTAERGHKPLVEMKKKDSDRLIFTLKQDYGVGEGSLRNYRKSIRKFFRFKGKEWWNEVKTGSPVERKVDPDKAFDKEEIDQILEEARKPRDKALIALLADSGLRIGAVLSFQMKHVDTLEKRATLTINEDANVKGDDGPKALSWSRGYLANWLDVHPRPDNPEAALIHKLRRWDENEDGALREGYATERIKDIAERAGFDRKRVESSLFRSTAITEWIREGMSEQVIKHRAGWSKDSRMFEVYSRVQDEEMNDAVFDHYGIGESESSTQPNLEECPQCRTPLRGGGQFCPGCGAPLTASASDAIDAQEDRFFESIADAEGDLQEDVRELRQLLNQRPTLQKVLIGDER